jgi:hypothetical protein
MVVVNSELLQLLEEDELRAVLGHEVGHIPSNHVLYRTALLILLQMTTTVGALPILGGLPLLAVRTALLEWSGASELSADRAAVLVTRDPLVACPMNWIRSGAYDRIIGGVYPTRDEDADPRAEAGDAVDYYTRRFKTIFREAGEGVRRPARSSQTGSGASKPAPACGGP